MDVSLFDFHLPEELIAQKPSDRRTDSRLLLLNKRSGELQHERFEAFIDYVNAGDLLVLNNTKVIPARILGRKNGTGAKAEVLLLKEVEADCWEALVKPGRRLKTGAVIDFFASDSSDQSEHVVMQAKVEQELPDGARRLRFTYDGHFYEILDQIGQMPLPPYIKEQLHDQDRYQTVYAQQRGSAAAPTAGLHFTKYYLQQLKEKGVQIAYVTLHVGLGTFRPVSVDNIEDHEMHAEYYELPEETAVLINETKQAGKRVIAVGTTSARTLETAALQMDGRKLQPSAGWTDIFIYPGYTFQLVDALVTNFHLPKSTLLMMISAFAGRDYVLEAYEEAIKQSYRFFSFGDAMFIHEN